MPTFAVILVAAGRSRRFGVTETKKPFVSLHGKPVWVHSAEKFAARPDVRQLIVVVSPSDRAEFEQSNAHWLQAFEATVVTGGDQRSDSVANGLAAVDEGLGHVAIHDAARPCVTVELIAATFDAAARYDCVTPAVPVNSTVKRSVDGGQTIAETVDRSQLYLSQTPQVFARAVIVGLFNGFATDPTQFTDEAQLAERSGQTVHLIPGCPLNLKLTTALDLRIADAFLRTRQIEQIDALPLDPNTRLA